MLRGRGRGEAIASEVMSAQLISNIREGAILYKVFASRYLTNGGTLKENEVGENGRFREERVAPYLASMPGIDTRSARARA